MANGMRRDEAWLTAYMAQFRKKPAKQTSKRTIARHAPLVVTTPIKKDRFRSAVEREFAQLCLGWTFHGQLTEWWYEPMKGLWIAPQTTYTPDFLLDVPLGNPPLVLHPFLAPGDRLVFVETKGPYIHDDDWIKAKTAAARYSCFRFVRAQWVSQQWTYTLIPPA